MSNTTSLSGAEATPGARLIVKAALDYRHSDTSTRRKAAEAKARQDAYGRVAADVLDIAMTPHAFALVIAEAVRGNPHPYTRAVSSGRAAELRETWQRAIVADVLDRLGNNNDLRPTPMARPPAPRTAAGSRPPAARYLLPGPATVPAATAPGAAGESQAGPGEGRHPDDPAGAAERGPLMIVPGPCAGPAEPHLAQGHAAAAAAVLISGDPGHQGAYVAGSRARPFTGPCVITTVGRDAGPEAGQ